MPDHPFESLREALLRMGVAPRHARRAVLELDSHFRQLVQEGLQRGDSEEAARIAARELLGADEVLISRYAGMPELRAWCSRWPAVWFTLVPLISFIALFVAAIAILGLSAELMSAYLHHVHVPALVSSRIDWVAQIFFLWVLPLSIAAVFAILAYRQRVALHWPVAGIAIVCCLVALMNVSVVLTGGASPGNMGAGIGISAHSLPGQMAHAVSIMVLVVGPLWIVWRRHRLDGAIVD
jgi:hypothetical protein